MLRRKEISYVYKEVCEKDGMAFNEDEFKEFLNFLEIDFYDWVQGNLNQFWIHKAQK